MAIEALMPNLSSVSASRQKPTRLPYSCQVQFGMSGVGTPPAGGVFTVRGIGEWMSHSSMETSTHTAMRLPSGKVSFGRRVIGEYAMRSIGNMVGLPGYGPRKRYATGSIFGETISNTGFNKPH